MGMEMPHLTTDPILPLPGTAAEIVCASPERCSDLEHISWEIRGSLDVEQ